jgi:cell wall assembly regulator SMI1
MSPELSVELNRLREILGLIQLELKPQPPASKAELAEVERTIGLQFDDDLRDFWRFSNGSVSDTWFAVMSDEITGCSFASLKEALKVWGWFAHDQGPEWRTDQPTDPRIRQGLLQHHRWFPFAEFNGFSTAVQFDGDPAPGGSYGQIIVYQHDPDAIYYVAESFIDFFRRSNDLLAANLTQIYFVGDEYERITHLSGLGELKRQMQAGLYINRPDWRGHTLAEHAAASGRQDIVDYLLRGK